MRSDSARRAARRERLYQWLTSAAGERAGELLHHLGDIHDACDAVAEQIEALPKSDLATKAGREALATLYGQLFEELQKHLTAVQPALNALLKESFRDADERGEL